VAGALATDVYNDVKAAGKAVVDKIRKPPPPGTGKARAGKSNHRSGNAPGLRVDERRPVPR
jgi:hypothetical protein